MESFLDGIAEDITERRSDNRTPAQGRASLRTGRGVIEADLIDICEVGLKVRRVGSGHGWLEEGERVEVLAPGAGPVVVEAAWVSRAFAGLQAHGDGLRPLVDLVSQRPGRSAA
jgi:hypothetical protein